MKSVGWLYGPCTHSHTELFLLKSEIAHCHKITEGNEICGMAVWPLHTQLHRIILIKSLKYVAHWCTVTD